MGDWILALLIGFVLDLLLGDPKWLYHPVCIIGKYISFMEKKLRKVLTNRCIACIIATGFEETCAVDSRYPQGCKGVRSACRGVMDIA